MILESYINTSLIYVVGELYHKNLLTTARGILQYDTTLVNVYFTIKQD